MIKKITLIAFLGLFTGLSTNAQSLANTYWQGILAGTIPIYMHWTATDLEVAGPDITFGVASTYTETPNSVAVTDVQGSSCLNVGDYSVTYSGNTVTFGLVNDPCTATGRIEFFTSGPFTKTTVSVYEAVKFENSKVFPNPTSNQVNLDLSDDFDGKNYILVNIQGQTVAEGTLVSGKNSISVSDLNSGLYMIKLKDNMRASIKFVKQ